MVNGLKLLYVQHAANEITTVYDHMRLSYGLLVQFSLIVCDLTLMV